MEHVLHEIPSKCCADGLYFTPHVFNFHKSNRRSSESSKFHSCFPMENQLKPSVNPTANSTEKTLRTKPLYNHSTVFRKICEFDKPKVLIQRLKLAYVSGSGRKCDLTFPNVASQCKLLLCTACAEHLSKPKFMEKFGCLKHTELSHLFKFHRYAQLRERKENSRKKQIGGFQCLEESKLIFEPLEDQTKTWTDADQDALNFYVQKKLKFTENLRKNMQPGELQVTLANNRTATFVQVNKTNSNDPNSHAAKKHSLRFRVLSKRIREIAFNTNLEMQVGSICAEVNAQSTRKLYKKAISKSTFVLESFDVGTVQSLIALGWSNEDVRNFSRILHQLGIRTPRVEQTLKSAKDTDVVKEMLKNFEFGTSIKVKEHETGKTTEVAVNYWVIKDPAIIMKLLLERNIKDKTALWHWSQRLDKVNFMVSGDHHHNQHTTYLTFENTVEPGADKNTFPIAGIYHKDVPNVIRAILDTLYKRLSGLHREGFLQFEFDFVPQACTFPELPLQSDKAAQTTFPIVPTAKLDNLGYSESEESSDDEYLSCPNIFDLVGKDTKTDLVQRYKNQFTIFGPEGDVETDLGELTNLGQLESSRTAHECDICLRVFNSIENLLIHASFWHEDRQIRDNSKDLDIETKQLTGIMKKTALYYALLGLDAEVLAIGKETLERHKQQFNFQKVGVKNIAKLKRKIKRLKSSQMVQDLENLKIELRERTEKISKLVQMRFPNIFHQKPIDVERWRKENKFVSAKCQICKQSSEFSSAVKQTAPRENYGKRRLKISLVYTGDGKELNSCVGIVGSGCFRCHIQNLWEWNTSRGKSHSMIRAPWETDEYESGTRLERNTEEAAQNWQRYNEKLKSLITDFNLRLGTSPTKKQLSSLRTKARKNSHHQERPTILPDLERRNYRVGEFHTAKNLGEKLYTRYIEICKLLDMQLTKNQFVTSYTNDPWEKHIAADEAQWSKNELLVANGPYMYTFLKATKGLGISWSNTGGGALIGDQAYAMFLYPELSNLFKRLTFTTKTGRSLTLGSDHFVHNLKSFCRITLRDLRTTCKPRCLCVHEIAQGEILCASSMRLRTVIYPSHVPPYSAHLRFHIYDDIKYGLHPLASDRITERTHQTVWRAEERNKRLGRDTKKFIEALIKAFTIKHTAQKIKTKFKHKKIGRKYMTPGVSKTKKRKQTEIIIHTINKTEVYSPPLKKRKRINLKLAK